MSLTHTFHKKLHQVTVNRRTSLQQDQEGVLRSRPVGGSEDSKEGSIIHVQKCLSDDGWSVKNRRSSWLSVSEGEGSALTNSLTQKTDLALF